MCMNLYGFFDELEKIGVSTRLSSFTQSRRGKRPLRVQTLLNKPFPFKTPQDEKTPVTDGEVENKKDYESETGPGLLESTENR